MTRILKFYQQKMLGHVLTAVGIHSEAGVAHGIDDYLANVEQA